ncbi:MAG: alpha/beta fold hydrolase [Baekduia sp.]
MRRLALLAAVLPLIAAAPAAAATHGDLVSSKPLSGGNVLKNASKNLLVTYKTQGVAGSLVDVTGSVAIPKGKAPKGGWPVFTWAHGSTGIADSCAPTATKLDAYINPFLNKVLKAGFAVVRTDYEGLGGPGDHPYLNGSSEGHSVLDIVRAARKGNAAIGKTVLIGGHSQGGHAALWAAALAKKFTPELKVGGTVAFAPASHIGDQAGLLKTVDLTSLSPLVGIILRGAQISQPSLNIEPLLSDAARAVWPETLTKCLGDLAKPDSWGALPLTALVQPDAVIQPVVDFLNANDPETLTIRTPVLVLQGTADGTVLPLFTDPLVGELGKNGSKPTYKKYTGATHVSIATGAKPQKDALAFVRSHD